MKNNSLSLHIKNFAIIILLGCLLIFGIYEKVSKDKDTALNHFIEISNLETQNAFKSFSTKLDYISENMRTISYLPSIKNINRYGTNIDDNTKELILKTYKNLHDDIALSEIYIVPVDLEPETVDPQTGSLQTPILMFDGTPNSGISALQQLSNPKIATVDAALKVDQIEIYEYRLLKEHMAYFKKNYPEQSSVSWDNMPVISGKNVITCDNDDYKTTKNDEDRTGMVLSVPFYNSSNKLAGTISSIVRNNVLKAYIPERNYAIINQKYEYYLPSKEEGQQNASMKYIKQGSADPEILFSKVIDIDMLDPQSKWLFWASKPDSDFYNSNDVKSLDKFLIMAISAISLLTMAACYLSWILRRNNLLLKKQQSLETDLVTNEEFYRIQDEFKENLQKTKKEEMVQLAEHFNSSIASLVSKIEDSGVQMYSSTQEVLDIALDTKKLSTAVCNISNSASEISAQIAVAAEELTASINEIGNQTKQSSEIANKAFASADLARKNIESLAKKSTEVTKIIDVITEVANQINLLALNASIEAARAGDSGKGFAVVASEVKNLAGEVGKSTQQITKQIQEMEIATSSSVESVMNIMSTIEQVLQSTGNVAASVQQQFSVTNDIAGKIVSSSDGSANISKNAKEVQIGAEKTENNIRNVLKISATSNDQVNHLSKQVGEFTKTIKNHD